jgi:hypothetical protein
MEPSMTSVSAQIWSKGVPFAHSYTTCASGVGGVRYRHLAQVSQTPLPCSGRQAAADFQPAVQAQAARQQASQQLNKARPTGAQEDAAQRCYSKPLGAAPQAPRGL